MAQGYEVKKLSSLKSGDEVFVRRGVDRWEPGIVMQVVTSENSGQASFVVDGPKTKKPVTKGVMVECSEGFTMYVDNPEWIRSNKW